MSLVLSIDVGTTNIKASLVNATGKLIKIDRAPQNILRPEPDAAEHCPKALFKAVLECCKEAIGEKGKDVSLISISSYHYGLVILDNNLNPISNMSTLLDTRSRSTYQDFLAATNASALYDETGCPSFIQSILPRLFYFKQKNPELISKGKYFLSSKSWLLYSFTGQLITEASTECTSQFLNIKDRKWSQNILDLVGIKTNQLPEIVEPLEQSFSIKNEIINFLGLSPQCKIISGVYDGGAICLGMNCFTNSKAVSNIGTSGMLRVISDKLVLDDNKLMRYQPLYLMNGKYFIGGATNNASLPLKWLKENLLELSYDEMDRLAHNSPVGSKNLFFMPYLTGERDINIGSICSGSFFGLREHHTRADFIRSILEGVTFNLNMIKESLLESGLKIKEVHIGGGGVRSADIWVEILSNILNLKLIRSQDEESCLIGNAVLGFTFLKEFSSLEDAGSKLCNLGAEVLPVAETAEIYKRHYLFFKGLYGDFAGIYGRHSEFGRGN